MADYITDIDLLVEKDTVTGIYDWQLDEYGQLQGVRSFDTALQMVVLTDRRADRSEMIVPQLRRGWLGNLLLYNDGFENGSKLWLLFQERRTPEVLQRAISYLREACQWFIDDQHCINVEVTGELLGTSGIRLYVNLYTLDNRVESKYFDLWESTGVRGGFTIGSVVEADSLLEIDGSGSVLELDGDGGILSL